MSKVLLIIALAFLISCGSSNTVLMKYSELLGQSTTGRIAIFVSEKKAWSLDNCRLSAELSNKNWCGARYKCVYYCE